MLIPSRSSTRGEGAGEEQGDAEPVNRDDEAVGVGLLEHRDSPTTAAQTIRISRVLCATVCGSRTRSACLIVTAHGSAGAIGRWST
jgi:hypothetical protein